MSENPALFRVFGQNVVREMGVEPTRPNQTQAPQACLSTNSSTLAFLCCGVRDIITDT